MDKTFGSPEKSGKIDISINPTHPYTHDLIDLYDNTLIKVAREAHALMRDEKVFLKP